MSKVEAGQRLDDLAVTTVNRGSCHLSSLLSREGKTAIVFLRYYGCPLCQYDMIKYRDAYDAITGGGNELVVALQSTGESIASQTDIKFPFDIICDPEMLIYKALDIKPSEPMKDGEMPAPTPEMLRLFREIEDMGIKHGPNEGIEEQLPAWFILDSDLNVLKAHYCTDPFDIPAPEDFAELFA